jgi:hypothetical protein
MGAEFQGPTLRAWRMTETTESLSFALAGEVRCLGDLAAHLVRVQ